MQNFKLLGALAALVMTATTMTACGGNECASGTTEKDGQCVPTSTNTLTCGEGTMLAEGKCVPTSTTMCGAGTMLENGSCVPTSTTECGDGTMLVNGECVPTSTITCGTGTMEQNGACVPTSTITCGAGTMESNGACVVAAPACGAGTQLDANSGTCVVTDAVCGTGTAFTNGACVPTDAVCAMGTTFNAMTGTCLPDATCEVGDVVLNGVCVSPVAQLLSTATVQEMENNDPALGGTAQALTLPAAGTQLVVAGAIGVPADLDADMDADQDSDAFTVTLAAGDLIQLSVQPVAGPSLGFVVLGPDGSNYTRSSTLGLTQGAARQIFAPVAGEYTVIVEPAVTLAGSAGPIGNADWKYALTAEVLAAPTATDVDVTMGTLTADLRNLNDNLFKLTNGAAGQLFTFEVDSLGADADGIMYIGDALGNMTRSVILTPSTASTVTLGAADTFVFVDWFESQGPANDVAVSFAAPPSLGAISATAVTTTAADIPIGASTFHSFTATAGQVLRIRQNNTESNALGVTISPNGAGNAFVLSATTAFPVSLSSSTLTSTSPTYTYVYVQTGGTFALEIDNRSGFSTRTNTTVALDALMTTDLGSKAVGESVTGMVAFAGGVRQYLLLTLSERATLAGTITRQGTTGDFAVSLYSLSTATRAFNAETSGTAETVSGTYAAGNYLVELRPTSTATGADYNINVAVPPVPPEFENTTPAPIVDDTPAGTNSTLAVAKPGCVITSMKAHVNISHLYKGDVIVTLTSPTGTTVVLHDNTGGSADDIVEVYPDTTMPAESLAAFNGQVADGTWTLNAADTDTGIAGTLNSWGLNFTCAP